VVLVVPVVSVAVIGLLHLVDDPIVGPARAPPHP
jgi:hypothetical protein